MCAGLRFHPVDQSTIDMCSELSHREYVEVKGLGQTWETAACMLP